MKVKYVGDAKAMSYLLGLVEPGKIYEVKKDIAEQLNKELFVEVKKVKKDGE